MGGIAGIEISALLECNMYSVLLGSETHSLSQHCREWCNNSSRNSIVKSIMEAGT